ncbi:hypothetical protein ACQP1G_21525 [Nocardia sp. CA-107356]|uniref:hypothetical protein n=1 Tax=Nocardia sp. CA-107356 TaxID=3239972 RepID=UPI003D92D3E3
MPLAKKTARWRVWQSSRNARPSPQAKFGTALQAEIWHRRYPPVSVAQALCTACGHPISAADMRVFAGLDILLRARGWRFIRECSGPQRLTFSYPPSEVGLDCRQQGLEPVTTVVVVVDRSQPSDTVSGCQVEILLVGAPHGHAHLTNLAGLTTHLAVIEPRRPTDPTPVPFLPIGRAHHGQRVDRTAPVIHGDIHSRRHTTETDDSTTTSDEELVDERTDLHDRLPFLDCTACHAEGVLVRIAELTNGGELWRCSDCGDEELID